MRVLACVASLVAGLLLLYFPFAGFCFQAIRWLFSVRWPHCQKTVCLTFDDGPDPRSTPGILRVLRERGLRATFFLLGKKAEEHPEIVADIVGDGHEIGEHGYSHLHPWKSTPWLYLSDLIAGHRALDRLLGVNKRRRYRPTFGKGNALTFIFAWVYQMRFTFWNVDIHDYREKSTAVVVSGALDEIHKRQGAAIVLLHDGRMARWEAGAISTVEAVDHICKQLVREGYRFLKIGELAASKDAWMQKKQTVH